MIPKQACLFRIRELGWVECEIDRDQFCDAVRDCRCFDMKIYGRPDQSLLPIHGVAEFFDVKADWQYDWEFVGNELIEPDVLIAVIQAW